MNHIESLRRVATHNMCHIDATMNYDRVTDTLIVLANTLANTETDEETWWLGESDYFDLSELITGAYWHYTDWHGGQDSKGYAALCALGSVFAPNMSTAETENMAYQALNDMAQA